MKFILVTTSDSGTVDKIKESLKTDFSIDAASSREQSLKTFAKKKYDFLLFDLNFIKSKSGRTNYREVFTPYWQIFPDTDIIVLTENSTIRDAVDAVKAGASDYLTLPINTDELKYVLNRIEENIKIISELNYLRSTVVESHIPLSLSTKSSLMKEVFSNVRSVAETDSTVLLTGETGTGKGLIAKLIHQESRRMGDQFISIHCGAIPDTLLESELFGHEKGAFTGAIRRKLGKFEIAEGGTIFLDEIGTVSSAMQVKLLQVLQDKIFYRVGGEDAIKSNVRIIAATNSDLAKLAGEEKFRLDLYYRLNVFQIEIPPLRERLEDLPVLVDQILKKLNKFHTKNIYEIHKDVMNAFYEYEWPGNIRELENLLERAYILENSLVLTPKSFPIKLFKEKFRKYVQTFDITQPLEKVRLAELERIEREYLTELLIKNNGRIKPTAVQAGIGERQLNKLMNKYNLHKENFKKK